MVDPFAVVLQHVLSNKQIRDALSADPDAAAAAASPAGGSLGATPLTVSAAHGSVPMLDSAWLLLNPKPLNPKPLNPSTPQP